MTKPAFAPIPMRAMGDGSLSARHLRLLMAIAAHDRMNANGRGCYATHERLAMLTGNERTTISKTVSDLVARGYVEVERDPSNRRRHIMRVIYVDADALAMQAGSPASRNEAVATPLADEALLASARFSAAHSNRWPVGQQPERIDPDTVEIVGEPANHNPDSWPNGPTIVGHFASETPSNSRESSRNISSERLRDAVKQKRNSVETASLRADGLGGIKPENVGGVLARLERLLNGNGIAPHELDAWAEWLQGVIAGTEHGDPNHGRAQRLLESEAFL